MAFLFKSAKKGGPQTPGPPGAYPTASRDIRSSDGQHPPNAIASLNGLPSNIAKPASPTPPAALTQASSNNISNNISSSVAAPNEKIAVHPEERHFASQDMSRSSSSPTPDQKTMRERAQDEVRLDYRHNTRVLCSY